jgi:hypothetical protein
MFELISLWIFNLLYPEQKSPAARKDEMNTAAAFFYGTSFESIGEETNRHPDETPQEQQAVSGEHCDYDDWFDF